MANHKSALKRHRQSLKKKMRNASCRSAIKTAVKNVKEAADRGESEEAKKLLKDASSLLDKAVSKGVLHRNNASRKISRLTTSVNSTLSK